MNGPVRPATNDNALSHWATELNTVLIGQGAVTEALLIALISGGHVLLEGPPGVGKGLIARALAASFGATFTPLPCPVTAVGNRLGHTGAPLPTGEVVGVSGLEHASPGGQAALQFALQATDEHALAQAGTARAPCLFIASRNLLDPMGTVALEQALLDRFMVAVAVPFPGQDDEARLVREVGLSNARDMLDVVSPQALFTAAQVTALQAKRSTVTVDEHLVNYAVRLVRATRFTPHLGQGAGPRAAIALVRYAQARALLQGRAYATPQDIKQGAPAVLRHRVKAAAAQRLQGVTLEDTLAEVIDQVTAPRP